MDGQIAQILKKPWQVYKMTETRQVGKETVVQDIENGKITFYRWGDEQALTIELLDKEDPNIRFYAKPDPANDSAYKFGVVLEEEPSSGVFNFRLSGHEDLDFFYQPPLENENQDGSTWEVNRFGPGVCKRPADITGSYAVYHKTKKDYVLGETNYGTGKAFHIYRPKFIDANGDWAYGSISIIGSAYTVVAPKAFLESAKYPVIGNDTFGYTTVGGSTQGRGWGYPQVYRVTTGPTYAGTVTSMSCYGKNVGSSAKFCPAIYNDGGDIPGSLVAGVNSGGTAFTTGSFAWTTTTISATVTAGAKYWLGSKGAANNEAFETAYDTAAIAAYWISSSTWPNPFGGSSGDYRIESLYATYTPSSSSSSCSSSSSRSSSSSCRSSSSSCSSSSSSSCRSSSSSCSSSSSSSSSSSLSSSSSSSSSLSSSSSSSCQSSSSSSSWNSSSSSCRSSSSSSRSSSSVSSSSSSSSSTFDSGLSDFSREGVTSLPADDTDLATLFTAQEEIDVQTINHKYVELNVTGGYAMVLMKYTHTEQHPFTVSWAGKSTRTCSQSPIYLQVYNRNTALWETKAVNSISPAGVDILLSAPVLSNLSNYFNGSFEVAARVYQQAI